VSSAQVKVRRGCRNTLDHIVKTNKNSVLGLITKKYFSSLGPCKSRSAFPTYTHCHSSRTHFQHLIIASLSGTRRHSQKAIFPRNCRNTSMKDSLCICVYWECYSRFWVLSDCCANNKTAGVNLTRSGSVFSWQFALAVRSKSKRFICPPKALNSLSQSHQDAMRRNCPLTCFHTFSCAIARAQGMTRSCNSLSLEWMLFYI
jgi:hypothetical protein